MRRCMETGLQTRPSLRAIKSWSRRRWPPKLHAMHTLVEGQADDRWPYMLHMEQVIIPATMSSTIASKASIDGWVEEAPVTESSCCSCWDCTKFVTVCSFISGAAHLSKDGK